MPNVVTITPENSPTPIGPYNHIAKAGTFIAMGGVAAIILGLEISPERMLVHKRARF